MTNKFKRFMAAAAVAAMTVSASVMPVMADSWTDSGWHYASDIDGFYLTDAQKTEVTNRVSQILAGLPLNGDKRHDAEVIYNWEKQNVVYDYTQPLPYMAATAYNAIHGSAVCEGYASLYVNLCTMAGIDCRLYGSEAAHHDWNIIVLDGKSYVCDCTWDSIGQRNKPNKYFMIDPASYEPMKQNPVDATVLYKIGSKDYFYKRNMSEAGSLALDKAQMNLFLMVNGTWHDLDKGLILASTGSSLTPDEYIYYGNTHLVRGTDYTVSYQNNINPGTASIIITGCGKYKGSVSWTFTITQNGSSANTAPAKQTTAETPSNVSASEGTAILRLYNPHSGEHFYTASKTEKDGLVKAGWRDEGIGWTAPKSSHTPVFRLYNKSTGRHHYTMNTYERDVLKNRGWTYEGVGWYSSDAKAVPVYREYNPHSGQHNYTKSAAEHRNLVRLGWADEGTGWCGI